MSDPIRSQSSKRLDRSHPFIEAGQGGTLENFVNKIVSIVQKKAQNFDVLPPSERMQNRLSGLQSIASTTKTELEEKLEKLRGESGASLADKPWNKEQTLLTMPLKGLGSPPKNIGLEILGDGYVRQETFKGIKVTCNIEEAKKGHKKVIIEVPELESRQMKIVTIFQEGNEPESREWEFKHEKGLGPNQLMFVKQLPDGRFRGFYDKRGLDESLDGKEEDRYILDERGLPPIAQRVQMAKNDSGHQDVHGFKQVSPLGPYARGFGNVKYQNKYHQEQMNRAGIYPDLEAQYKLDEISLDAFIAEWFSPERIKQAENRKPGEPIAVKPKQIQVAPSAEDLDSSGVDEKCKFPVIGAISVEKLKRGEIPGFQEKAAAQKQDLTLNGNALTSEDQAYFLNPREMLGKHVKTYPSETNGVLREEYENGIELRKYPEPVAENEVKYEVVGKQFSYNGNIAGTVRSFETKNGKVYHQQVWDIEKPSNPVLLIIPRADNGIVMHLQEGYLVYDPDGKRIFPNSDKKSPKKSRENFGETIAQVQKITTN